jgi:hypothetical protein
VKQADAPDGLTSAEAWIDSNRNGHMYISNSPHLEVMWNSGWAYKTQRWMAMGATIHTLRFEEETYNFFVNGSYDGGLRQLRVIVDGHVEKTFEINDTEFEYLFSLNYGGSRGSLSGSVWVELEGFANEDGHVPFAVSYPTVFEEMLY